MSDEPETYIEAGRIRKVLRFVCLFRYGRMSVAQVKRMGNDEWNLCATMLGVSTPTSDIFRTCVIQVMSDWNKLRSLQCNKAAARSIVGDVKRVDRSRKPKSEYKPE